MVCTDAAATLEVLAAENTGDAVRCSIPVGFGGSMWLLSMNLWPMIGVLAVLYLLWLFLNL